MNFPDLPKMPQSIPQTMEKIADMEVVKKALDQAVAEQDRRVEEQIALTEVEAPPFHEEKRAALFAEMLKNSGLENVRVDEVSNVIGVLNGDCDGPTLVIGAHTDSVFPAGTDVKVRRENGVLRAPGIADDTAGLAALLQLVRMFKASDLKLKGRLIFVGNVGEEGNGDLRGTKHLFNTNKAIDGFISIDGADVHRLLKGSTGSKRFRMVFSGPGGHSFTLFGKRASATHALCRLGAKIADMQVPTDPITTFTVGVIGGGTGVNAIADHAEMQLDLRSQNNDVLNQLVEKVFVMTDDAVREENERWGVTGEYAVKVEKVQIGYRPAGMSDPSSPVLFALRAAMAKLGIELTRYSCASTDQNVPLSLGIPATTIGTGGTEGNNHALTEWFNPEGAYQSPQLAFLATLALLGVEGVCEPLLVKRN